MSYNINYFLKPLSPDNRNIQILDDKGVVKYTINPFSIINTSVSNNLVRITLRNDKIIILDFFNSFESKSAIVQLQQQIDSLTQKVPFVIDKAIENYIDGVIQGTVSNVYDYIDNVAGEIYDFIQATVSNVYNNVDDYIDGRFASFSYNDLNDLPWVSSGLTVSTDLNVQVGGNLVPDTTGSFNLGSPDLEWHTLYVGSQSLVVGGVTISSAEGSILMRSMNLGSVNNPKVMTTSGNDILLGDWRFDESGNFVLPTSGDVVRDGSSVLYRYSGTSSTSLQLPQVGQIVNMTTQDRLGFKTGQSIFVYSVFIDYYIVDDYVDDNDAYFTGNVTGYNGDTGVLELLVDYSPKYGLTGLDNSVPTYSNWYLEISPPNFGSVLNNPEIYSIITSDGNTGLVGQENLKFDGLTFSVLGSTKLLGETQFQQTVELLNKPTSGGSINYNFNLGSVWIHDDLSSDYDAYFDNVPSVENRVITVTIIIYQSGTAYKPTNFYINGASVAVEWANGSPPTPNASQTDILGFSLVRFDGGWKLLGQMSTYTT